MLVKLRMPAPRRILVLVNPAAGRGGARRLVPAIASLFHKHSLAAEFVEPQDAADLARRAAAGAALHNTILVMGGDGTFQLVVRATLGTGTLLGILPVGGGNDVAVALGIPKDPIAAAAAFLSGAPRTMDVLRARCSDGRSAVYLGGGGIGLDAAAARLASGRFSRWPGAARYVASALWAFKGFVAPCVEVELDGARILVGEPLLLAVVTNTPAYGAGLRIAPEANINDGLLDITLVGDLNLLRVLEAFPVLLRTGDLRWPEVKRFRGRRVALRTELPSPFHGDGEILGETPVEIDVLEGAIQVIAPQHV